MRYLENLESFYEINDRVTLLDIKGYKYIVKCPKNQQVLLENSSANEYAFVVDKIGYYVIDVVKDKKDTEVHESMKIFCVDLTKERWNIDKVHWGLTGELHLTIEMKHHFPIIDHISVQACPMRSDTDVDQNSLNNNTATIKRIMSDKTVVFSYTPTQYGSVKMKFLYQDKFHIQTAPEPVTTIIRPNSLRVIHSFPPSSTSTSSGGGVDANKDLLLCHLGNTAHFIFELDNYDINTVKAWITTYDASSSNLPGKTSRRVDKTLTLYGESSQQQTVLQKRADYKPDNIGYKSLIACLGDALFDGCPLVFAVFDEKGVKIDWSTVKREYLVSENIEVECDTKYAGPGTIEVGMKLNNNEIIRPDLQIIKNHKLKTQKVSLKNFKKVGSYKMILSYNGYPIPDGVKEFKIIDEIKPEPPKRLSKPSFQTKLPEPIKSTETKKVNTISPRSSSIINKKTPVSSPVVTPTKIKPMAAKKEPDDKKSPVSSLQNKKQKPQETENDKKVKYQPKPTTTITPKQRLPNTAIKEAEEREKMRRKQMDDDYAKKQEEKISMLEQKIQNQNSDDEVGEMPRAFGDGLKICKVGEEAVFQVDSMRKAGQLTVNVKGSHTMANCQITPPVSTEAGTEDKQSSTCHTVSYLPEDVGKYSVFVLWNDLHVRGSPFTTEAVDPTKIVCVSHPDIFTSGIKIYRGRKSIVEFDYSKSGRITPSIEVIKGQYKMKLWNSPVTKKVSVHLEAPITTDDGLVKMSCGPYPIGEFNVYIQDSVHQTSYSDLRYESSEAARKQVIMKGQGAREAWLNEEAHFLLDGSCLDDADPEIRLVKMTGKQEDEEIKVNCDKISRGIYRCNYMPVSSGPHGLFIKWGDTEVSDSPFLVNIWNQDPSRSVICKGKGLLYGLVGEINSIEIDTENSHNKQGNELSDKNTATNKATDESVVLVSCASTTGRPIPCQLTKKNDTIYEATYKVTECGYHTLTILYGGMHVPGSPYRPVFCTSEDLSRVKVDGAGLSDHNISSQEDGESSQFRIDTRQSGYGKLAVNIRGPHEGFQINIKRDTANERIILCDYSPREPGEYVISILWNGFNITNSPFNIQINK